MEMLNEILKWEKKRWKGVIYAHILQSYKQYWGNFAYHSVLTCMSIFLYLFIFLYIFSLLFALGVTQLFVK